MWSDSFTSPQEVQQEVQDEYNEQQESLMDDLVFSDSCSSWCESPTHMIRPHTYETAVTDPFFFCP